MKYYKVKADCDQLPIVTDGKYKGVLIANELYTAKQADKIFTNWMSYQHCFDIVNISAKRTVYIFGARFETKLS